MRAVLLITTVCDRHCPECCYRIPSGRLAPHVHFDWPYFERASRYLQGLEVLRLSGGEPTLHPDFPRIAREFRALFRPKKLALTTNGSRVVDLGVHLHQFDQVEVTNFPDGAAPGAIAWLHAHAPSRLAVAYFPHRHLAGPHPGAPCPRRQIPVYAHGRIYPCCVGPGIPGAQSLKPTKDWAVRLATVPLPCATCTFSTATGADAPPEHP